jgi:hypothetical protein
MRQRLGVLGNIWKSGRNSKMAGASGARSEISNHQCCEAMSFSTNFHCKLPLRRKKTLQPPLPNAQTNGQNDAFLSILVEFSLIASYFHLISAKSNIAEISRF